MKTAKLLILSPWEAWGNEYRIDYVLSHMPEMPKTHTGTPLKSQKFPELKGVIQTGFSTIRGSLKLKQIPVYAELDETTNPMNNFEVKNDIGFFNFEDTIHTQEQLTNFALEFGEKTGIKGGDAVVNTLAHQYPLTFGTVLGSTLKGARSIISPNGDGLAVYKAQGAKVLVVCPGKAQNIKTKGEIDTLVIGTKKKENIETVTKMLHDRGVKAKQVLEYNLASLNPSP